MADINIPTQFKELLENDQALSGVVSTTLSQFGEILEDNKLYFFEEYTDHGIKHIESVLRSSEMLVTDDTFKNVLTPVDAGYYTLAVILHDIGMHLGIDGFKSLLNGDYDDVMVKELDSKTWKELWDEYYGEAKRFSGKQLKNIFGKEDEVVREPPLNDIGTINSNDRKLIGEFIRRHHPRLAHEIALKGFPGRDKPLIFTNNLDNKYRNLIGLIARSHGLDLRKCIEYIESLPAGRSMRRIMYSCHAVYLMVLLRVGDYLQIERDRTSEVLIKLKTFSSPLSDYEHKKHLNIDSVDYEEQDDPELIFVHASPVDSVVYLKLNRLIYDIQYELDLSWAVLGELYGNTQKKPEVKYRRIKSNLEDKNFISQQEYVADSFAFKANDEITKLLIAPLYGDNPTYGVRELLQNAIDACKEREISENDVGSKYVSQVLLEVFKEADKYYFRITDNGVGMDLNVLKNYFLSAGASFRKSIDWQRQFVDEEGKSIVRRSGRFGVGILAAFLIGEKLQVKTKKNNGQGFAFSANLNSDQINIKKINESVDGTTITISITEEIFNTLNAVNENRINTFRWNKWYTLDNPSVEYLLQGMRLETYAKLDPDKSEMLPDEWNVIDSDGYEKVFWTYSNEFANVPLSCNGIVISNSHRIDDFFRHELNFFYTPKMSVIDNNGTLPLSLDRSILTSTPTYIAELKEDIYRDYIACLLTHVPETKIFDSKIIFKLPPKIKRYNNYVSSEIHPSLEYPGCIRNFRGAEKINMLYGEHTYTNDSLYTTLFNKVLQCKGGFIINHAFFLEKIGSVNKIHFNLNSLSIDEVNFDLKGSFLTYNFSKLLTLAEYKIAILGTNEYFNQSRKYNSRYFLSNYIFNRLFGSHNNVLSNKLKSEIRNVKKLDNGWSCFEYDSPPTTIVDTGNIPSSVDFIRETCVEISSKTRVLRNQTFDELLELYIGNDVIIPYNIEDRKKKYPLAFKELERYMKKYLKE